MIAIRSSARVRIQQCKIKSVQLRCLSKEYHLSQKIANEATIHFLNRTTGLYNTELCTYFLFCNLVTALPLTCHIQFIPSFPNLLQFARENVTFKYFNKIHQILLVPNNFWLAPKIDIYGMHINLMQKSLSSANFPNAAS